MKKQRPAPASEQITDETDTAASMTKDSASEASGLKWLKYAGIGPARTRQGKGKDGEEKGTGAKGRKLSGEGITSLGSLEAELMSLLWDIGEPAASMDVMEQSLYKRRSQGLEPASFATIATTLRRLTDKGVVTTHKNAQGTPVYVPTVQREEMAARILNNVSVTLLGQSLHGLLPRLLGTLNAEGSEAVDLAGLMKALEDVAGKDAMTSEDIDKGSAA